MRYFCHSYHKSLISTHTFERLIKILIALFKNIFLFAGLILKAFEWTCDLYYDSEIIAQFMIDEPTGPEEPHRMQKRMNCGEKA